MNKKVYITDLIGTYCGMHYYDEAFAKLLRDEGFQVEILSTFNEDGKKPYLPLIFHKNKIKSVVLLIAAYFKFLWHTLTHRDGVYVYMCYGEFYDLLMMTPNIWSKRLFSDVHEVHALKYADGSRISRFFNWYYTKFVKHFIYHSDRTKNILTEMGVTVPMLYVPHFKYNFKKDYDSFLLSSDIANVFTGNKTKFLFFGNLSVVKGIDTVIDVFLGLTPEQNANAELVIAGKNVDFIDFSELRSASVNYKVFDRHINDDELVYLYSHTDYILLPYKKSSQSGIFAMATYFRKPMLLTDIPYFKNMIDEYPSFGRYCELEKYGNLVEHTLRNNKIDVFYTKEDCDKSEEIDVQKIFIKEFREQLI